MVLTSEQLLHYYRGRVKNVVVQSDNGLSLQIPLVALRPFVSHSGIEGYFRLVTDNNNKLQSLEKLS